MGVAGLAGLCAEEAQATLIVTYAFDDGDPFTVVRSIRRSALACRESPTVVLTTLATALALQLAKHAGADAGSAGVSRR